MDVAAFVSQRLGKFRQRGKELQLHYCPFCHGGKDRQRFTFSINIETGAYNCLRLNNCGVRGSFRQLQDKFGEASDVRVIEKKAYRPPTKHKIMPLVDTVKDYLILERGITEDTLEVFKIGSDGKSSVVFPFYENGKLAMTKFRGIKDKSFHSDGYKPILFGIDACSNADTLVITEGEIDCLSVYQSLKNEDVSGVDVVGMPNGANNLEFINLNWDFLKGKKIILFGDNDKAGIECMQNISDRLGNCSWILSEHGKDANEIMLKSGMEQVVQEILNASAIEDEEICLAVNIESKNIADVKTVPFGFYGIDSKIGGSRMGEITVWTGYPGSGKTTILNQLILNTIDTGEHVGLYSGEFAPQIITSWIDQQAAGAEFLTRRTNKTTGMDFYIVDNTALDKIRAWYGNKLVLYAPRRGVNVYDDILEKFQHIYNRYGCRVFVVDNLLKVMTKVDSRDYNTKQAEFVDACTQFAHDNNVHIHIVAHPRKSVSGKREELELDDVAGTSNIGNLADNVLAVKRVTDKDRKADWYAQIQKRADMQDFDAVIMVMKNRFGGVVGGMVPMTFDVASKRYVELLHPEQRKYGWGKAEQVSLSFDD